MNSLRKENTTIEGTKRDSAAAVTVLLTNHQAAQLDELAAIVRRKTGRGLSRSAMIRAAISAIIAEDHTLLLHASELEIGTAIRKRVQQA